MYKFKSITYNKEKDLNELMDILIERIKKSPKSSWILAIGTDSQNKKKITKFCQVVLLHEESKGGQFFYSTSKQNRIPIIQNRMLEESRMSIDIGKDILDILESRFLSGDFDYTEYNIKIEIHCDLGENGKSKDSIKSAIGWITAEFGDVITPKVKPDSCAASHIADRYTK